MADYRNKLLTLKQQAVLRFISLFATENGFPPSIREIGGEFKIAPSSALDHLKALERKGFIKRLPFKPRCLEVLKTGE
jgi:repressor LexA